MGVPIGEPGGREPADASGGERNGRNRTCPETSVYEVSPEGHTTCGGRVVGDVHSIERATRFERDRSGKGLDLLDQEGRFRMGPPQDPHKYGADPRGGRIGRVLGIVLERRLAKANPRLSRSAPEDGSRHVRETLREPLAKRAGHASDQFHFEHGHGAIPRQTFRVWTARIISNSSPFGIGIKFR